MAQLISHRRFRRLLLAAAAFVAVYCVLARLPRDGDARYVPSSFDWARRPEANPVDRASMIGLPEGPPRALPRIQHEFSARELTRAHNETQRARRDAVREAARRSWRAYRQHAWGRDELAPQKLVGRDTFAGWGATLVDSLDTLWIMGMKGDFRDAVRHVATIDWDRTASPHCSLFETNIRYLGGLLAAYDLSGERVLLDKAVELGDMLYAGFDTPSRMPANVFDFARAKAGTLLASDHEATAAVGTLSLEFTRLAQLTGDAKYHDAVDRVKRALARTQAATKLPGMWPVHVDLRGGFRAPGNTFSLGAAADSLYEYLAKMHALLGGRDPAYEALHARAAATAAENLLFRPMLPPPAPDILFSGTVISNGVQINDLVPEVQHLGCFAGGMFALGGRLFGRPEHVVIGERLARGCAWAYAAFPQGVMPDMAMLVPCERARDKKEKGDSTERAEGDDIAPPCAWNETRWREKRIHKGLLPPFAAVTSPGYLLRPEAIESVFVLYRVTGRAELLDEAWRMFEAVRAATRTEFAHAAVRDVRVAGEPDRSDSMESFWLAETLKYFYLIFSEPELISLDDYVFNTEAHPFRLPKPGAAEG